MPEGQSKILLKEWACTVCVCGSPPTRHGVAAPPTRGRERMVLSAAVVLVLPVQRLENFRGYFFHFDAGEIADNGAG